MTRKRYWNPWIVAAAVALAAAAAPALPQYKTGHGINATVYESPT